MGLCGGYNLNVNHLVLEQIQPDDWCFLIGKKGRTFFQNKKIKFYKTIAGPNISFSYDQAQIIANDVLSLFHTGQVTCIQLVYSHYINQMTIQPVSLTLLPITDQNQQKTTLKTPLEFEPHPSAVLKAILPFYLNATIFGAVTEAMLCEQIARRVAMDGATRNADKISKNLITQYNKTRQQAITQEIIEIISGATYTNN